MSSTNQLAFRDRLYHELPPEWFPPINEAPNVAAVLDMLAAVWTSERVVSRTVQFDVTSDIVLIDGTYEIPIGTTVTGTDVIGNPTVTRVFTETIDGTAYQTLQLSIAQILPAGTLLAFAIPDAAQNGIVQSLEFVQQQNRLQTATGPWLDTFGEDFFGNALQRHISETDDSYRRRILFSVISPKVTRCALSCGVTNLTGYPPVIIEPRNTNDCGSYTDANNVSWGGLAYGKAGAYGSLLLPYQLFIQCTRPNGEGIPNISGYGNSTSGYATAPFPFGYTGSQYPANYGTGSYVQLSDLDNHLSVTDADIYAQVANSLSAGVTAWTAIASDIQSEIRSTGMLDITFYLGLTTLAQAAALPGQMFGGGSFRIAANATAIYNGIVGTASLQLAAAGVLDNPVYASATITVLRFAATVGIGSQIADIAASFAMTANAVATTNQTGVSAGTLVLSSNAVAGSNNVAVGQPGPINLAARGAILQQSNITMLRLSASALAINGTTEVDYLTVDFVVGTSLLIPPGGRLGRTLLLGRSNIGVDYGY